MNPGWQSSRASEMVPAAVAPLHEAKVAPKYRNTDNPSETWAGRGLKPRWLAAALKAGMKMEQFAIGPSAKTAAVKKRRPKARKPANK